MAGRGSDDESTSSGSRPGTGDGVYQSDGTVYHGVSMERADGRFTESTQETIEEAKNVGNDLLRKARATPKTFVQNKRDLLMEAMKYYSMALDATALATKQGEAIDPALVSICYSNRALLNMMLAEYAHLPEYEGFFNYPPVTKRQGKIPRKEAPVFCYISAQMDAMKAVEINPTNVKGIFRAVTAHIALGSLKEDLPEDSPVDPDAQFNLARQYLTVGLMVSPGNKDFLELQAKLNRLEESSAAKAKKWGDRIKGTDLPPPSGLAGLPAPFLGLLRDRLLAIGSRDDVAALRATCKTIRSEIAPAGKEGMDELTPKGATVSVARLEWSVSMCGWPDESQKQEVPPEVYNYDLGDDYDVGGNVFHLICGWAAQNGDLEVLKFARQNGAPWDVWTCVFAARGGHLEMLKWARENGAPWDKGTCLGAARGGYLEVLKWARQQGAPWDTLMCASAAAEGHLEVLKWARENGAPWCVSTCGMAASGGHLELIKWARQHGAPWDEFTYMLAAKAGRIEMLEWLKEQGAPWDSRTCATAAEGGQLEALKWLRQNGAPWDLRHAVRQHGKGSSSCSSGRSRTERRGWVRRYVELLSKEVTSRCSSGREITST